MTSHNQGLLFCDANALAMGYKRETDRVPTYMTSLMIALFCLSSIAFSLSKYWTKNSNKTKTFCHGSCFEVSQDKLQL